MTGCQTCNRCGEGGCRQGPPTAQLPTDKPLAVWDGQCTFCRRWSARYHALRPNALSWAPMQVAADHVPGARPEDLERAIHLVETDGTVRRGADAMYAIMAHIGLRSWPAALYRTIAPFRVVSEAAYGLIARYRGSANTASTLLHGRVERPVTFLLTRRIFLRLLGLVYLLAFLSLGQQAVALFGSAGLVPIDPLLEMARATDQFPWWRLPTFQWLGGDALITTTWIVGLCAGACLCVGLLPAVSAAICWLAYLSLTNAGGVFMQYQWDALLLETGVLAVLWAPWTARLNSPSARRPSVFVHWLIVLLCARLVFFSGLVKLISGDPAWADCSALSFHFWSQPLPWWPAWYVSELSHWWLKLMCILMFAIELGTPVLMFLPRVPRTIAALAVIALMLGIAVTGNYGFFNLLTFVLCLALLDDAVLLMLWPRITRGRFAVGLAGLSAMPARVIRAGAGLIILSLVTCTAWTTIARAAPPTAVLRWLQVCSPWHITGSYGLFATMTTTRPEIRIEATMDGHTWAPVVFKWKPGPLDRAPGLVAPFMPRLDWQMWFDALSYERLFRMGALQINPDRLRYSNQQVLPSLLKHLANGTPGVLGLLAETPMKPGERPVALRWMLDDYQFTTSGDQTEDWWTSRRLFTSPPLEVHAIEP